ncbi:PAS domain-containing protein [Dyadobacter sandarakinus]|uniref:histidine kinase n=1 Tax=Dyadobacter sandarakinus TaxID=2747268 RepID=A0ABX7I389_9BACT|nr:PAS domain-containing protein [Dyadobacter sandarakinus]QRR00299.1 PAS domain-containing protein [Dyadobacter sandarakinus]
MPSERRPRNKVQGKDPDSRGEALQAQREESGSAVANHDFYAIIAAQATSLLWMTTAEGRISYHNPAWLEFTGRAMASEDVYAACVHEDDRHAYQEQVNHATVQPQAFEATYRLLHHSGAYRWIHDEARPVITDDGQLVSFVRTGTDVHDAKVAAEAHCRRLDDLFRPALHDLRSSLGIISGAATLLKLTQKEDDRDRALAMIHRNLEAVNEVMDRLLQYPNLRPDAAVDPYGQDLV